MSSVVAQGGGDVWVSGEAVEADCEVSQAGHHVGASAGAYLGGVFPVGGIADPVQSVLDAPASRCI